MAVTMRVLAMVMMGVTMLMVVAMTVSMVHGNRLVGIAMRMLMAMVPELGLGQQKEKHQPDQQHHEQIMGTAVALERFGQQMHEGRGEQGSRSQAQQTLGHQPWRAPPSQTHQQRGHPDTADTSSQGGQNNCYQCHSFIWLNRNLLQANLEDFRRMRRPTRPACDYPHTVSPGCA